MPEWSYTVGPTTGVAENCLVEEKPHSFGDWSIKSEVYCGSIVKEKQTGKVSFSYLQRFPRTQKQ